MKSTLRLLALPFLLLLAGAAACSNGAPGPSHDAGEENDAALGGDDGVFGDDGDLFDQGNFADDSGPGEDSGTGDGDFSGADGDSATTDGAGDNQGGVLVLYQVAPSRGGASVATPVTLTGQGFGVGLEVTVGGVPASNVVVVSATETQAVFEPVALPDRGPKDVRVALGGQESVLPAAFEYFFDEDPIVFVHGYAMTASEWNTMIGRFEQDGYPADQLFATNFTSSIGSNVVNARDELPPFVDDVLAKTGVAKVDIICHSNGGMSTRLWIGQYGGGNKVRDYVSLSGTHHGTQTACLGGWLGDAAKEQCPSYASESQSYNNVQWLLNGDPDTDDVDETPYGVEDGGGISWHALWTDSDLIDLPPDTCCLNQKSRGDCSDPVNVKFHGVGHIEMATDLSVYHATRDLVRQHNLSKP